MHIYLYIYIYIYIYIYRPLKVASSGADEAMPGDMLMTGHGKVLAMFRV